MALRWKHNKLDQNNETTDQDGMMTTSIYCLSNELQPATFEDHLEVTREQYLHSISIHLSNETEINRNRGGLRRFTKLLGNRSLNINRDAADISARKLSRNDDNDENFDGNRSLNSAANYTIGSLETLKASNARMLKQNEMLASTERNDKHKSRWNPLKRIIKIKPTPLDFDNSFRTEQAVRKIYSARHRAHTEDSRSGLSHGQRVHIAPNQSFSGIDVSQADRDKVDDKIRGRLYGVDMLSLGDGRFISSVATSVAPWDTPFVYTFTGQTPHWSPQRIVDEMLLSSSGRKAVEIVLDGYIPGPDGRWIVQIEVPRESSPISMINVETSGLKGVPNTLSCPTPTATQQSLCDSFDDVCNSKQSSLQLQQKIWGSEIPPIHFSDSLCQSDEDAMHALASRCSIPIDTDNDSFLIATKEHVEAIQDVISINLTKGQFAETCRIFNLILRGISTVTEPDLRYLRGAILHNLGIVQMRQENTRRQAVLTIQKAIHERQNSLPPKHPDIIASISRKGEACFAVGDLKGAISALEAALSITSPQHLVCAKVLNNLGVAYYFDRGGKPALKEFIKSLSIQRNWLESTIRRESMVYDAVITLGNMGKVYLELAEFDLSLHAYEEAVLLLTSVFSKDHDMVLSCLSSLAVVKSQSGDLDHGLQILKGCLRSQNNRFGEMSAASIETIGLIGYLHAKKGEFGAALQHLSIVRKWQKIHLPPQHQSSLKTKESIKILENRLGIVRSPSIAKVWV